MTYDYQVVYNFPKEVTNHDALALGFNTEINSNTGETLLPPLVHVLDKSSPFPPTPSSTTGTSTGALTENDMTRLYGNVIKTNNRCAAGQ